MAAARGGGRSRPRREEDALSDLFRHQVAGVEALVADVDPARGRVIPGCLWLGDELGAGKTRQVIEAAQQLFVAGQVRRVVVIAPGTVARTVWHDPEYGQLAEYRRADVAFRVTRFHSRSETWQAPVQAPEGYLDWIVTNYEYMRRPEHLEMLLRAADETTLLVLDESIAAKDPGSQQTRACGRLRRACGRAWLLNGTEGGGDTPADLYAQARMMSPAILGCKNKWEFQARYARTVRRTFNKRQFTEVVGWTNLDDLWRRLSPYYLRRTKAECLDLPPKLPPVSFEVPAGPGS